MRVPILAVIFLVFSVVGGTWWWNTRKMDFMTPPSEAKLRDVREKVESSFPPADEADEEPEPVAKAPEPPPAPPEPPKPVVDLGDLTIPPALQDYGVRAPDGAAKMIELAAALEEKGEFQRALLAWERVLDLAKPDESQAATAVSAVKRLRPTLPDWNSKPEAAIALVLHAGTGKKLAKDLKPILAEVSRELGVASSGIVKFTPDLIQGKTSPKGATPVAIWLSGPGKKTTSTETLSFTVESPDKIHREITRTVYLLVSAHLGRSTAYTPPPALDPAENPMEALSSRVTRLSWNEFATAMNLPPPKKPK